MPTGTPRRGQTRRRMIESTIALLRERGAAGTTIDSVLEHSGAPRGSVYHHFPGGRRELLRSALEGVDQAISALLEAAPADDPRRVLDTFATFWRTGPGTGGGPLPGCPVVALVVDEAPADPEIAALARDVLDRWRARLASTLTAAGLPADRAARRATLVLAALEGAVLLCRADGDDAALDATVRELGDLLDSGDA